MLFRAVSGQLAGPRFQAFQYAPSRAWNKPRFSEFVAFVSGRVVLLCDCATAIKNAKQEEKQSSEESFLLLYDIPKASARKTRSGFRKWNAVIGGNSGSSLEGT